MSLWHVVFFVIPADVWSTKIVHHHRLMEWKDIRQVATEALSSYDLSTRQLMRDRDRMSFSPCFRDAQPTNG